MKGLCGEERKNRVGVGVGVSEPEPESKCTSQVHCTQLPISEFATLIVDLESEFTSRCQNESHRILTAPTRHLYSVILIQ